MVNLTSFNLFDTPQVLMDQLLDFFESPPRLRKVHLSFDTQFFDAQNGRLVSLPCLENMWIDGHSCSTLLGHLSIPVGACLGLVGDLPAIEHHPPRFFDNLRNLPNSTKINLIEGMPYSHIDFSGPNGEVKLCITHSDRAFSVLKSLAQFNTSTAELLRICGTNPPSSVPPYRALLPMKDLLTLDLRRCSNPQVFIHALDPSVGPSGVMVCQKLEKLVIEHTETLDIKDIVGMATARASRGKKLKSVTITYCDGSAYAQPDVLELKKLVSHVQVGHRWIQR